METPLSLKTWPDVTVYDTFITDTLQDLRLSNLETDYAETSDGKDTWTIRDPEAKADIICIVIDGALHLHVEPIQAAPAIHWVCDQLTHAFAARKEVFSNLKTTKGTYLQWSMAHRAIGPTIEMAHKRLEDESKRCTYPSLAPIYTAHLPQDPPDGPWTNPG